jgi:transposase
MDALDDQALAEIQTRIAARMVTEFGLGLSGLALDMTNFATFIDSANDKAPIAQLGHAKQKRTDLRLVGLGMVVSRDGAVPLIGHPTRATGPTWRCFPPSWMSWCPATGHWPPRTRN